MLPDLPGLLSNQAHTWDTLGFAYHQRHEFDPAAVAGTRAALSELD